MPLSSNSIIHFTKTKEALMGILADNFKIKYCKEVIKLDESTIDIQVPMVSFCDIPLSQIKEHIRKYGNYGIGLSREWAVRNGLNPVLYVEPQSHLARNLRGSFVYFLDDEKIKNDEDKKARKQLFDTFRYMKNYQGKLVRMEEERDEYRFSDEREWRYVPSISLKFPMLLVSSATSDTIKDAGEKIESARLKFEPKDIRYIIINNDDEIAEFILYLQSAKGANYSLHDVQKLTTRIMTAEQIKSDI